MVMTKAGLNVSRLFPKPFTTLKYPCVNLCMIDMQAMKNQRFLIFFLIIFQLPVWAQVSPVDKAATKKTRLLYTNLAEIARQGVMFGHQDDQAYGLGWWDEKGRSDVKEVTGSYPSVHGWDLGDIGLSPFNLDTVNFTSMRKWIKAAYKRGGINTISWHLDNPKTGGSSWDKTPSVKEALPGGEAHEAYLKQLDALADFLKSCKVGFTKIPIIFRPFHEHNGNWFWWGKGNCEEQDYKALWRFTADYLKNQRGIHHLLYAFSPDRSRLDLSQGQVSYFYGYPGDEYVDIIGLDNYWDVGHGHNKNTREQQAKHLSQSLSLIHQIAREKNKVAALTETGHSGLHETDWFTQRILKPLKDNKDLEIAWVLVWRNRHKGHFYTPPKDHPAAGDFQSFFDDPITLFEKNLRDVYKAGFEIIK